jgi:hypothetical protein
MCRIHRSQKEMTHVLKLVLASLNDQTENWQRSVKSGQPCNWSPITHMIVLEVTEVLQMH